MKRSVDGTIFSREFETGGRSAIDGTPLHIGANPGSPDDQKSSTERLHPTAVGCHGNELSRRYIEVKILFNFKLCKDNKL